MMNSFLCFKMKRILFIVLLCSLSILTFGQTDNYYLYIGTYREARDGIHVYQFNTRTGDFIPISNTKNVSNPSFLAISPNQSFLYSLGGMKGDSVRAFAIDKNSHKLTLLNSQGIGGSFGAVYLEVDKTGKWLIVGSYLSGSVTVLPIQTNGMLCKASQTIQHNGNSINQQRQEKPHVHSINISPNNKDVFVPDLGIDKIMTYTLNDVTGHLSAGEIPFTIVSSGSGPRHFTFHPSGKFAYVIKELDATITGFTYTEGKLEPFQTVKTLPNEYKGRKWAADIHISPDGKFLYTSNRIHDSLAIFSIDKESGKLIFVGHQFVKGKTPRNFVIDPTGNFILVANQDSNNITIFKRNKETGKLTYINKEIMVLQPVCLKFNQ